MATNPDLETDIPQEVLDFLHNLNTAIESRNPGMLHDLYESQFEMLTKNYYIPSPGQFRPWPPLRLSKVSNVLRDGNAQLIYTFLYYKHLFTDKNVQQLDAKTSWENFTKLFTVIHTSDNFPLPNWLVWDIMDEFVFQMTVVYQKRIYGRVEWSVTEVFKLLATLSEVSGALEKLQQPETAEEIVKSGNTKCLLGFFAIISKAKVNVLLGDYYSALSDLSPLDIFNNGRAVLQKVTPALISLLFHVGFSYLMLSRFEDASNSFRRCLTIKCIGRKFSERVQLDAAYMFVCARVLGGMPISNVTSFLDSRKAASFDDDKESLRVGDEERFREVFDRCSPKFLTVPPLSAGVRSSEGKELQARMFRRAVQQQQEIIKLRGYFGVYQNAKMDLLKTLLETDDAYAPLFALKMRSRQLVHDGETADLLSGTYKVSAHFDCVVEDGNVEVVPYSSFDSVEIKFLNKIKYLNKEYRAQQQRKEQFEQQHHQQQQQQQRKHHPNSNFRDGSAGNNHHRNQAAAERGTAAGGRGSGGNRFNGQNRSQRLPPGGSLFNRNEQQ